MGVGSHASRYIRDDDVLTRFVDIELAIGFFGGVSAALLFLIFSWAAAPFRAVLYSLVFLIGALIGLEIPLVMRALNARKAPFADLVSRVLTFDYLGALAVSLLFPLVLAPRLGLSRTSFLFGIVNVGVALWTIQSFHTAIHNARGRVLRGAVVLALLGLGLVTSDRLVYWGEHGLFGDEIIYAATTPYQRLVVTRWKDDLRLYINGNLQFSSRDEHRYHEALVHPALASIPWAQSVLVLGGGDGLAVREILRYPNIKSVTLVDLDSEMTSLFSSSSDLVLLNHGSLKDPRVRVINADAAIWIAQNTSTFDAIFVDFPDPSSFALGKLYSVPFYSLVKKAVSSHGIVVVQSTSPYFAPHAYWSIDATLKEAGFLTFPYHAYVPSFGEWGFILSTLELSFQPPQSYTLPMRYLNAEVTREMFSFPPDMPHPIVEANHLNDQSLVRYFDQDWHQVIR
jgi:spermidine synthase